MEKQKYRCKIEVCHFSTSDTDQQKREWMKSSIDVAQIKWDSEI